MNPLIAALALLPSLFAQTGTVSLDARGQDVREVLATLFAQVKKPYALDASIKGSLYVKLDGMAYDKALGIVLTQAGLAAKEQDGVVVVSAATPTKAMAAVKAKKKVAVPKKVVVQPSTERVLGRKVTTRLSKAPLATVFASLGKQAGTAIVVDPSVPAYKIDANFSGVTLRTALHQVCEAAGLEIQSVEGKIRIYRKTD